MDKIYQKGYEAGQRDYADGWDPVPLKGYPKPYRDGYSDGYWKAQGGGKLT